MPLNILVLEQEPVCARLISLILAKDGYSVLEAGTCEEAIRLCSENNGSVPLLIADVTMGDSTGLETAQMLREVWPAIAVLFTGTVPVEYWTEADHLKAATIRGALFLGKPFQASELRQKVSALLESVVAHNAA